MRIRQLDSALGLTIEGLDFTLEFGKNDDYPAEGGAVRVAPGSPAQVSNLDCDPGRGGGGSARTSGDTSPSTLSENRRWVDG